MSGNPRRARVASAMVANLSELVRGLDDPRLARAGLASINHVELNRDMSIAQIYISFIGGDDRAAATALGALSAAKGRLRGPLGRRLHLKRCPELRFFLDQRPEFNEKMARILEDDSTREGEEE